MKLLGFGIGWKRMIGCGCGCVVCQVSKATYAVHSRRLRLLRGSLVCSHCQTSFSYAPAANSGARPLKTPGFPSSYRLSVDDVGLPEGMIRQVMKARDGVTLIEVTLVRGCCQGREKVMQMAKKPPRMEGMVIQGCCCQR